MFHQLVNFLLDIHHSVNQYGRMMNQELDEVAASVQAALDDSGKSTNWLAVAAKIPYSTLSRKLDGVGEFKFSELRRIAEVLDVHPSTLVPPPFRAPALAAEAVAQ